MYELLLKYFSSNDIERQYHSKVYPFNCDFYIKPLDLYIKCNYHWTHGKMPFDNNDLACMNKLNTWVEKAKKSDFYKCAIDVWTHRDCEKMNCVKNNKLNALFIYPKNIHSVFIMNGNTVNCM